MEQTLQEWLQNPWISKTIATIIGLLIIGIIVRLTQKYTSHYVKDTNTRYRVRKIITFIGYILVVFMLAIIFSEKLGGLGIILGVAGAGIAFALQEVIISVAGWFAIIFSHFYKTGDRVQLGGIKGDVIDIGILRTTLMEVGEWVKGDQYNGRVVRIANSFVFKEPVFNYSGDFPFLWDEITIPVRHGSDYKFTFELLRRIADEAVGDYSKNAEKAWEEIVKKFLIENARVEPLISMEVDQNWMTYSIRYVVDYKRRRMTKNDLFSRILDEF